MGQYDVYEQKYGSELFSCICIPVQWQVHEIFRKEMVYQISLFIPKRILFITRGMNWNYECAFSIYLFVLIRTKISVKFQFCLSEETNASGRKVWTLKVFEPVLSSFSNSHNAGFSPVNKKWENVMSPPDNQNQQVCTKTEISIFLNGQFLIENGKLLIRVRK